MSALSIIESFAHQIDSSIEIDFDSDFCVDVMNKIVYIADCEHEEEDRLIQKFVQDKFNITMNPFLIGVLHEIGHIMTYDEIKDEERAIIYGLLTLSFGNNDYEKYSYMYFSIPAEFEATTWAVNYYLTHKEACDNFLEELFY